MRRLLAAVSTLALLLAPLVQDVPASAAASVGVDGDFDGDGQPDLVMGWTKGVDVRLSRSGVRQRINAAWLGQPNDEIGSAHAVGDVDADGYADLMAGIVNASGAGLTGVVLIAYGLGFEVPPPPKWTALRRAMVRSSTMAGTSPRSRSRCRTSRRPRPGGLISAGTSTPVAASPSGRRRRGCVPTCCMWVGRPLSAQVGIYPSRPGC